MTDEVNTPISQSEKSESKVASTTSRRKNKDGRRDKKLLTSKLAEGSSEDDAKAEEGKGVTLLQLFNDDTKVKRTCLVATLLMFLIPLIVFLGVYQVAKRDNPSQAIIYGGYAAVGAVNVIMVAFIVHAFVCDTDDRLTRQNDQVDDAFPKSNIFEVDRSSEASSSQGLNQDNATASKLKGD